MEWQRERKRAMYAGSAHTATASMLTNRRKPHFLSTLLSEITALVILRENSLLFNSLGQQTKVSLLFILSALALHHGFNYSILVITASAVSL